MSSTSSSDCETCDYCQCGRSLDNNYSYDCYGRPIRSSRHVPFCSGMGHPLIYYAEVQRHSNRRQRCDQPRKENKNCFVKAFEWYTQERVPASPKTCPAAERCGFANWLDSKYIEYLHDSRMEQHVYQLTTQPTTIIEPCDPCPSQEPCTTTKRFARMKSPWRKRRRSCKDSGDVPENRANQSCEFIMQPKDLTRAASDCCYPSPTSGCNKSNATVVSSSAPGTRGTAKSFSMTSVCRETNQNPIDIIPCTVQEGSKTKPPPPTNQSDKKACCECREQIQQVPSKSIKSKNPDVSCQCPEEKVVPVNVQTQYECLCVRTVKAERDVDRKAEEPLACCKCVEGYTLNVKTRSDKLSKSDLKPKLVPSKQNSTSKKKVKHVNVSCQCPEEAIETVDTPSQYQPEVVQCECMRAPLKISAPNVYASNVRAPSLGATNVCAPSVCASNVCDPNYCAPNVYASNIRAPSLGATNVCASNIAASNVCAPTVCASNVCDPNYCAPNVCALKVCAPNVCGSRACTPSVCASNICAPNVGMPVRDMKETQQVFGPAAVRRQSFTTVTVSEVDACACGAPPAALGKDITVTKYSRSLTLFANDGVQTSDHSICFERDGINQYPFYMKIVCADRLNNVCF